MAKQKILIVDDELDDMRVAKTVLEKEGYNVVAAANGMEALDRLKNDNFSLILLDIQMPSLSGYDLLRLLRERLNHKVKMVFFSIVPKNEVVMEDVDGFVQKLFSPESLLSSVKKVLK